MKLNHLAVGEFCIMDMDSTWVESISICMWFELLVRAVEVLSLNNIELATFAKAIYDCLNEGRRQHRNIMLFS